MERSRSECNPVNLDWPINPMLTKNSSKVRFWSEVWYTMATQTTKAPSAHDTNTSYSLAANNKNIKVEKSPFVNRYDDRFGGWLRTPFIHGQHDDEEDNQEVFSSSIHRIHVTHTSQRWWPGSSEVVFSWSDKGKALPK